LRDRIFKGTRPLAMKRLSYLDLEGLANALRELYAYTDFL